MTDVLELALSTMRVARRGPASAAETCSQYELSDLGNARRLVDAFGDDLLYASEWGQWLVWTGSHWERDVTGCVFRCIKAITETILDEARATADDKLFTWGIRSQSAAGLNGAVRVATTEPTIPVLVDQLDADPWKLSVNNGTLDLRTCELRSPDRADLITKVAPVDYEPDVPCPTFDAFLERILPDPTLRWFLQKVIGYCLTGLTTEQVLFALYGFGANGKSTFAEVLFAMLGEHAAAASPRLLVVEKHSEHPTAIANLHGRRLVVTQEIEAGHRFDEALVKQLTGSDRLTARYMRQDFWSFTPTHKLIVCCNHKPGIQGTDLAIWRRIHLIPFTVSIPAEEQDKHLLDKLKTELPGILAWAVRGCLVWQHEGLVPPKAVVEATEEYRVENDEVAQFLADTCGVDETYRVSSTSLYEAYIAWASSNGIRNPLSQKALAPRIRERGFDRSETHHPHRVWWMGLGLRHAIAE
jgi:putative DNA primase/helicase